MEVLVLPSIDGGTVNRLTRQDVRDLSDHRLIDAGLDIYGGEHDWKLVEFRDTSDCDDVVDQLTTIARCDRRDLDGLIVNDQQGAVLRRKQMIIDRITGLSKGKSSHLSYFT